MKQRILLFSMLVAAITVNAQIFTEYFEGATVGGNLEGYNNWYVSPKSSDANGVSPKIEEFPLFYSNYPGTNIGKTAVLDSAVGFNSATQRISTKRVIFATGDTLKTGTGGALYAAFIVNVSSHSYRSYRDFFTWESSETSSFTRGRVFAKNNTEGTEVTFALTKNSSSATDFDQANTGLHSLVLGTGINHLLVVKYEIVTGDSNDKVHLFVNPDPTKAESEQAVKLTSTDTQTDYSATQAIKINLRQRGIGAQVSGIRVGRSWEAVVMGVSTGVSSVNGNMHQLYTTGTEIVTNAAGTLKVYSLSGTELIAAQVDDRYTTGLNKGLYIVRFTDHQGAVSSAKIQIL